jgi:hypothetical protein
MIQIIFYVLSFIVGTILLNVVEFGSTNAETATTAIFYIAYVLWGVGLVVYISDYVRDQIQELNKIDEKTADKESYSREMEQYKEEMEVYLTEEFPDFEERIIKNISDSKALATIIEKEGFQKIIATYDYKITHFLNDIGGCDRAIAMYISNLRTRQEDKLGFGMFIPYKYKI